jgi:dihydropteroate synthase
MFTINCKGKLLIIDKPIIMGIINATTDSFYSADALIGMDGILALATKMINDGAAILDIGGQSTKPNSVQVSAEEEIERVIPVVKMIHEHFPKTILSIDTFYSKVAIAAVAAGASMVNDVSAGEQDINIIPSIAQMGNVPYICMHMRGNSKTMQTLTDYDDIVKEIIEYFIEKTTICKNAGINDVIIDPGFGFAKTTAQNFTLLKKLSLLKILEKPILVGLSRKSMIYKTLGITASQALNGTTVLNTLALQGGANILRVHDVKEAMEVVKLYGHFHTTYNKRFF